MAIIPNPQFPITPPIAEETEKYRIALFQGGLGDLLDHRRSDLYDTVKKIIRYSRKDTSPYIFDNNDFDLLGLINMSHFDTETMTFEDGKDTYYVYNDEGTYSVSKQMTHKDYFETQIRSIYEKAKSNPTKTFLVRTYLNRSFATKSIYDSIENQKKKLIYIIDAFMQYADVEIYLVGHSQGGLVNMEAAIERSNDVARLISISTPYASVDYANFYYFYLLVNELINNAKYILFKEGAYALPDFRLCVEKLASSEYFDGLKQRWNNLDSHPKLTVITGTAGRICSTASSGELFSYSPEQCESEAFDGIVKLRDQKDITYANFINLIDKSIPCYEVWENAAKGCVTSTNCTGLCTGACSLDTLSIGELVFETIKSKIENLLGDEDALIEVQGKFKEFAEIPIINTIYAGIEPENPNYQCREGYEDYYRVASSQYNHSHIRYTDELIELLFDLLTEY